MAGTSSPFRISSWVLSAAIHLGLVIFLVWEGRELIHSHLESPMKAVPTESQPIQAVAVNQKQLDEEIQRLAHRDAVQKALEADRLNRLAVKASMMEKKRAEEEARLKLLQQAQADAKKKAEAERIELKAIEAKKAEMLKKQAEEQERLQQLAQKRAHEEAAAKEKEKQRQLVLQRERELAKVAQEKALSEQLAFDAAQLEADQARLKAQQQARRSSELQRYTLALRQQVGQHWVDQGTWQGLETKLMVRLAPGGSVLDVVVVRSSGNIALDRSARAAIYKASPLPVPADPDLFASFQEFQFTFKPDDLRIG